MELELYWLKSVDQKVSGPLSRDEIIQGIRSGRYSGSEEIAPEREPASWSKLAAHSQFYDEFLRRLFNSEYEVSAVHNEEPAPVSPAETVDATAVAPQPVVPSGVSLPPDLHGHTIHQSEIDALFSKVTERPAVVDTQKAPSSFSEERPDGVPKKRSRHRFRLAAIGVTLLAILYLWGRSTPEQSATKSAKIDVAAELAEPLQTGIVSPDLYAGWVEESDELFRLDLPIFLEGAENILKRAIGHDPKSITAYARTALVLSRLYATSISAKREEISQRLGIVLKKGREIEPQLAEFYVAEGEVALASGDLVAARRFSQYAKETSPAGFLAEQLQIAIDANDGSAEKTLESIRRLPVPPSHRVRFGYIAASLEKRLNRIAEARATLLDALKENPLHVPTYLLLGEVFSVQNELKDARAAFETAGRLRLLDGGVNAAHAYLRLAQIENSLGMTKQSEKSLRIAYFFGVPDIEISRIKGEVKWDRESIRSEAEKDNYNGEYFFDQGRVLLSERNYPAAALFLHAAHEVSPRLAEPLLRLGIAIEAMATSLSSIQQAASLYRRAIEKQPDLVEGYIRLGMIETDRYNFEQGHSLLKQALALAPEFPEAHIAIGKHFYKRQDYQASLEHFLKAKKLAPFNSEVPYYAGLLISRFSKEQLRDAMSLFYKAYALDPQNYDALVEWLKLKVNYYEKNFAIKFIDALIKKNPSNAHYHWAFGEVYAANNEFNRAIQHYHAALDLDNRLSKVRASLAKALKAIGEVEAAIEEYRLSSKLDLRNGEGFYQASELNIENKNLAGAHKDISDLLAVLPFFPGAHRQMSKLSYLKGNRDLALSEMRKEVDNNPINTRFRLEMAELLFGYRKYEEAVVELSQIANLPNRVKAPEYTNDKIVAYLWLSRSYRALSRFESAEGAIRLALELDPNDPELHREQGFVFQGQRRDKEAALAFQNYLRRNPAAADTEQIKKLIEQLVIED